MHHKLKVIYKDPKSLILNDFNTELHGKPECNSVYAELKASIIVFGILSPIILTKTGKIRSGNLRTKIAIELEISSIPCIVEEDTEQVNQLQKNLNVKDELMDKYRTILHDLRKKETVYSKIWRKEILENVYCIGQGTRSDISPEVAAAFKERNKVASQADRTKLNNIRKALQKAYPDNKEKQDDWLKRQGSKASIKTVLRDAQKLAIKGSEELSLKKETFNYIVDPIRIYNQSCFDLSIIPDKSIGNIVTSPPYHLMRPAQQGIDNVEEIGTERDVELYTNRLVDCFIRCKQKLTDDGSIWVNLADIMKNGSFKGAPELFLTKMLKAGFICSDKIFWAKTSAQPGDGDNTFQNVEYLFKFSISEKPYTDYEWLNQTSNFNDNTFGKGKRIKLSSFVNLKNSFVRTSAASTATLRKACENAGFFLEHTSTYLPEIPYLCIKLSSKLNSHVMDIFNGCGNTAIATLYANMNLTYHGFEINPLSVRASKVNVENIHGLNTSDKKSIDFNPEYNNSEDKAA